MRLLVTRPREDAEALTAALARRGIETLVEPLLSVADVDGPAPDLSGVQAILITSANGVRAFARRHEGREIAVYAVGDASARAARELGFSTVVSASGDVDTLAALVEAELDPAAGALIHVAGSHVAGNLSAMLESARFEIRRHVLYEARAAETFSGETENALRRGELDGVLLYSPRTAAAFARLVAAAGLSAALDGVTAYCLSEPVANEIRDLPWHDVIVAPEPDQEALLDAVDAGP
ncbi:MAG: uroporphyrinogen-III synthase [Rhodospirillales bacterium]